MAAQAPAQPELRSSEWFDQKMRCRFLGYLYYCPEVLVGQALVSLGLAILFGLKAEHWSRMLIVIFAILGSIVLGCIICLFQRSYSNVSAFIVAWVPRYFAITLICRTAGFLAVLKGFVYLSSSIEHARHIDLWAIGFFLACHLCIVSVAKMFGGDDILGVADSLMALATVMWVNFEEEKLQILLGHKSPKWAWVVFYGVCFLLYVFKSSKFKVRGIDDDEDVEACTCCCCC